MSTLMPHQRDVLEALKWKSTWILVLLTVVTLGIYVTFYAKRQSEILNERLSDYKIPMKLVWFYVVYSFIGAVITIAYVATPIGSPEEAAMDQLSNLDNIIYGVTSLIWSLIACSRLNYALGVSKGDPLWSQKWWSWLFGPFYFNYRVNKMNKTAM